MLSYKPTFSLFSFTFFKRLFSSSLLSAIRVVSSSYLRLLLFLPASLTPACASLQVDSLPTEPPVKPKNTEVCSLSFLQGIFLTQELNQGLLHCRQILYQLSYREAHIVKVLVTQSCPALCNPMDCSPLGSSVRGILHQEYWNGLPFPSPEDLPKPEIEPGSTALQPDSLPSEPQGKLW